MEHIRVWAGAAPGKLPPLMCSRVSIDPVYNNACTKIYGYSIKIYCLFNLMINILMYLLFVRIMIVVKIF